MARVRIITHGCKTNQYDGDAIARSLARLGYAITADGDADVYVVNTCAVTVTAQAKGRKLVRRLARLHPGVVLATGCAAEVAPESLRAIPGIAAVIGNSSKQDVVAAVQRILPLPDGLGAGEVLGASGRTRAIVKVQDGCDMACSYCVIRLARGPTVSRPASEILGEVRALADGGVKEIVLTGIRLGAYKHGERDLAHLLEMIDSLVPPIGDPEGPRVRLSSLDVWDLTPRLLEAMAACSAVCPHLHLPLQSGDDAVLRAMKRPYTTAKYAERVEMAREAIPGVAVTTDVMVGFPGESEGAFENTFRLASALRFAGLHVFRYSPRPGTEAARMPGAVAECVKSERSQRLSALGKDLSRDFAQGFVGKRAEVLFETYDGASATCEGLTRHYVRVRAPGSEDMCNALAGVRLLEAGCGTARGVVESMSAGAARG